MVNSSDNGKVNGNGSNGRHTNLIAVIIVILFIFFALLYYIGNYGFPDESVKVEKKKTKGQQITPQK